MFISKLNKFGKLIIKQEQEVNPGSQKKITWICDCNKETLARIKHVVSNNIKSCGKCNSVSAKIMTTKKFGALRIKVPRSIMPGSGKSTEWVCDCGNTKCARINRVFNDKVQSCGKCNYEIIQKLIGEKFGKLCVKYPQYLRQKFDNKIEWICECAKETLANVYLVKAKRILSCGKCNEIPIEIMCKKKFGKLRMKHPKNVKPGSNKKEWWVCDCGKESLTAINLVIGEVTTSCGRCNEISIEITRKNKFGKLRMKYPKAVRPGSNKKETWICDCDKEVIMSICTVVNNDNASCGKCNEIPIEIMCKKKFGKLKMKYPKSILPGSNRKEIWVCDCGQETTAAPSAVTSYNIGSCGNCFKFVYEWFDSNREIIRNLKCPILAADLPLGGPVPLEIITKVGRPFKALCSLCKSVYNPRFSDIKLGVSLTCGCSQHRISNAQRGIAKFIESFKITVVFEQLIDGLHYDIFIPSHNLLIEYNGLKWHSYPKSKEKDLRKYRNAIDDKYNYLMIFEDEWVYNRSKVESLLKNKLNVIKSKTIRPSKCEIKIITHQEANLFYDQFHYIGKCHPKLSYGVFYNSQLIACISFAKPTRQTSKYQWELVRMASDPEFRIHGIWSNLLKLFIRENQPTSIVSFSDNRLFPGSVYEKIGFKFDGEIPSDYYWVKGQKRHHKSGLRKTEKEKLTGLTETQLREAQGYKKIWDLGKKRWVLYFV
jgi:hypothetical protein